MTAQINLYHARFRKKHLLLPFSRMVIITLFAGLTIPAMIILNELETNKISNQSALLKNNYKNLESEWVKTKKNLAGKKTDKKLTAEITELKTILAHRSELIQLATNNRFEQGKGYSDHLIALARQHTHNIWLTNINISKNGTDLSIEGKVNHAATLANYLKRLDNEPVFSGMQFGILRIKDNSKDRAPRQPLDFLIATVSE